MAEALPTSPPVTLTIGDGTGNGAVLVPKPGTTPMIDGQPIDKIEIKGYDKNTIAPGVEGARLAKDQTDTNGNITHKELSYNPGETVRQEDADGILIRQQDGTDTFIPMSEFTVASPEPNPVPIPEPEAHPATPLTNLEKRATEMKKPTSISLIGLDVDQSIQARAAKDMEQVAAEGGNWFQRLTRGIWKGNIAHELLEEHAYQFRKKQVDAAHMMLSDETFDLIQTRANERYDTEMARLKKNNKLKYAWIKFTDAIAQNIGARTSKETYAITIAGDMYSAGELSNIQQYEESLAAVRTRYEQDFLDADGVIRKNLGESLTILTSDDPKHQEIVNGIKDLVHRYVSGDIASKQELDVALSEFAKQQRIGTDPKTTQEAQLYASSLYQIANEAKVRVESGVAIAAIDDELNKMEIRLGRAQMGESTQFQQTKTEKIVTWMASKNLIGTLFANEATAGTATAVALTLGYLPQTMIRSAAARLGLGVAGGGAVSGIIAGLKENARMKREYFQFMRQRETGAGDPRPGDKLREWMKSREIPQVAASELMSRYTATAYKEGKFNADISDEDLTKTLAFLADAKARRALSARSGENISLIRWGPAVDVERANLDLSIDKLEKDLVAKFGQTISDRTKLLTDAQTKVLTSGRYKAQLDDPIKIALDAVNDNDIGVQMFRRKFLLYGESTSKGEAQGLDAALAEIRTQIRLEAARRGVNTAVIGTGIGTALSEGGYLLTHPDAVWQNIQHALHIGPEVTTQVPVGSHLADVPNLVHVTDAQGVDHAIQAAIPEHTMLVADTTTHTYTLMDANHHDLIHGITFDTHGQITNVDALNASQDAIDHGLHFGNSSYKIPMVSAPPPTPGIPEVPPASGTIDLRASEWGEGGFWQYAQEKLAGQTIEYRNAATNASMQALRGYELHFGMDPTHHVTNIDVNPPAGVVQNVQYHDTIWGKEVYFNAMPNTATIHVPASLFSDQSIINLGHAADEAARQFNDGLAHGLTSDQILAQMDRLHQIAFKIGYHGMEADIPTKEELQYLMDHLNGPPSEPILPTPPIPIHYQDMYQGIIEQHLEQVTTVVPPADIESLITPVAAVVPLPRTGMKPGEPAPMETPNLTQFAVPEVPFYFGYGGYGASGGFGTLESWTSYANWLKKLDKYPPLIPPETERNSAREQERIKTYLDTLPPEDKSAVKEFSSHLPEMDPNCRIIISMPAFHEERGIYHTLEQWANQVDKEGKPIDKSIYEIDIAVNREEGTAPDRTMDEIKRFQTEHPDVHVNVIDVIFPKGQGGVGAARKIVTDVALQRSVNRGTKQTAPLYIESEDADLMEIDTRAISNLIDKFDRNPSIDALRGKQDLEPQILKENDYLFFERRVERFSEYLLRDSRLRPDINPDAESRWNTVVLGGWNSAFTAEAYALIGGYQKVKIGEDVDIGSRISLMRGSVDEKGNITPNTRVIDTVRNVGQSNPRRFIYALITGKHAYHTFGDKAIDEAIRSKDPIEILRDVNYGSRITEENKDLFEEALTKNLTWLHSVVKDPEMQKKLTGRLMTSLGFSKYKETVNPDGSVVRINGMLSEKESEGWKLDYHIEANGYVVIDNIGNIANALEAYRQGKSPTWTEIPVVSEQTPEELAATTPVPQPETEKPASLFELLDANGGTATITPEDVPLYLPTLIAQLAPVLKVPAGDITTTQTHTDTTWHIEARTKDTNQLITVDLTPHPTAGFDVKLKLQGFGLKNTLSTLVNPKIILSGLNGKLTTSEVTKLTLHPDGTIEFSGKKK